jgi:hypothetical protein
VSKDALEINVIVLCFFVYINVFVLCFIVNFVYVYCMMNLLETKIS